MGVSGVDSLTLIAKIDWTEFEMRMWLLGFYRRRIKPKSGL